MRTTFCPFLFFGGVVDEQINRKIDRMVLPTSLPSLSLAINPFLKYRIV